jgi:hypothetical protein
MDSYVYSLTYISRVGAPSARSKSNLETCQWHLSRSDYTDHHRARPRLYVGTPMSPSHSLKHCRRVVSGWHLLRRFAAPNF